MPKVKDICIHNSRYAGSRWKIRSVEHGGRDGVAMVRQCSECGCILQIVKDADDGLRIARNEGFPSVEEFVSRCKESNYTCFSEEQYQLSEMDISWPDVNKWLYEDSTDFKTVYDLYLNSEEWRVKRSAVLERDKHICQSCLSAEATQVHHTNYDAVFDESLLDLVSVCSECHTKIHEYKARASLRKNLKRGRWRSWR